MHRADQKVPRIELSMMSRGIPGGCLDELSGSKFIELEPWFPLVVVIRIWQFEVIDSWCGQTAPAEL